MLGVAGLLSASALLAIGILLVGRFGSTQGRILGSTALLAGYGLLALPATVLLDLGRARTLARAAALIVALGAALALAFVWSGSQPAALGRAFGTVTLLAVVAAQASGVTARRQDRDPPSVRRLFAGSCATGALAAAGGTALLWTQPDGGTYPRLFGALVVLDLLLVALQPVLARARPAGPIHHLQIVTDSGEAVAVAIEGGDLATAAAKAIRAAERDGRQVTRIEVGERPPT